LGDDVLIGGTSGIGGLVYDWGGQVNRNKEGDEMMLIGDDKMLGADEKMIGDGGRLMPV
jgi:hypothetical protein